MRGDVCGASEAEVPPVRPFSARAKPERLGREAATSPSVAFTGRLVRDVVRGASEAEVPPVRPFSARA